MLCLDRFADYSGRFVVAPVRETASQVRIGLGCGFKYNMLGPNLKYKLEYSALIRVPKMSYPLPPLTIGPRARHKGGRAWRGEGGARADGGFNGSNNGYTNGYINGFIS